VRGARFVGSDASAIVVSVEMPDLSTLAKVDELQRSNPEIAAVIAKIAGLPESAISGPPTARIRDPEAAVHL